jgi:hypothetical protein
MGSSKSKPRKKKKSAHPQHLPKVGTPAENQRLQHAERQAVLDNMGAHSPTARIVMGVVLVVVAVGAILGLLLLTVFH